MSSGGESIQGNGHLLPDILALVEDLASLTEQQVAAARTLEGPVLQALDRKRSDALFELQVLLESRDSRDRDSRRPDGANDNSGLEEAFRDAVLRLRSAEDRLVRVSRTVLGVLAGLRPAEPAPTYGRSGQIHRPAARKSA